ncbi:cytochrome c4 [Luteimonas marina]|uniref:Cytochrome c4 n=1 Tax=Luteimonas marina TaxID=488485 RepID=A0A5C5U135_9GAMM|nr:c-type cytochrome [Luteimonas marina]TWT19245.1 cytochrome c4 [Luteimonas marina]
MRHARAYGLAGLVALVAGTVAFAQSTVEPLPDNPPVEVAPLDASAIAALTKTQAGDAERGATLAGTCAACHGLDGNPPEGLPYPRIAGQGERYIAHQLALFKSGERNTGLAPAMIPFATPLSAQDMRDLGAYFATQTAAAGIADDTVLEDGPYKGLKFYEIGQQLYRAGDASRGLPACMACHGPAGAGNPGPAYPSLAGQEAAYVDRRLQEYRAGTTSQQDRHLFDIMAQVAAPLTDQEIQSLASYLQGLHERPDAATLAAIESAAPAAPAPAAAPAAGEAPAEAAEPAPAGDDAQGS